MESIALWNTRCVDASRSETGEQSRSAVVSGCARKVGKRDRSAIGNMGVNRRQPIFSGNNDELTPVSGPFRSDRR